MEITLCDEPQHALLEPVPEGAWGGPGYGYRDAEMRCLPAGHVCALHLEPHPLHGPGFGVAGTITPVVDSRLDHGRLPDFVRAVPSG